MELNKAIEILEQAITESAKSQVTKKYGDEFSNNISPRGLQKHKEVRNNEVNELIAAAKRNLPDEEKNSTIAIDREANRIEAKRENTKNNVGEYRTDRRRTTPLYGTLSLYDARQKDAKEGYPRAINKSIKRHYKKMNKLESLSILEEMLDIANSIFERSLSEANPEAPTAEEIPPSTNKIKQTKKDKDTDKKTEVVSVADELFPYEGNAKQQMNQKILAKINDMIEGTATLEDLLQLVRKSTKKPVAVKEGWDKAEAVVEELISTIQEKHLSIKDRHFEKHASKFKDENGEYNPFVVALSMPRAPEVSKDRKEYDKQQEQDQKYRGSKEEEQAKLKSTARKIKRVAQKNPGQEVDYTKLGEIRRKINYKEPHNNGATRSFYDRLDTKVQKRVNKARANRTEPPIDGLSNLA